MFNLLKKRDAIARKNIKFLMPELSDAEVNEIADMSLKHYVKSVRQLLALYMKALPPFHHIFKNPFSKIETCIDTRDYHLAKTNIFMAAHYSSWHMLSPYAISKLTGHNHDMEIMYVVSKMFLRSDRLSIYTIARAIQDNLYNSHDGKTIIKFIPPKRIFRTLIRSSNMVTGCIIFSDQFPVYAKDTKKRIPVKFFGKDVLFSLGAEQIARKMGASVYYLQQNFSNDYRRISISAIKLTTANEDLPYGYITQQYATELEKQIRTDPTQWLWQHKRFKDDIVY